MLLQRIDLAFSKAADQISQEINRIASENEKNGFKPGVFRIVPKNSGFAVEEFTAGVSGTPFWNQVAWANNRPAAERAKSLRERSR